MSRLKQKPSEPVPSQDQKLRKALDIEAGGERGVIEGKKDR